MKAQPSQSWSINETTANCCPYQSWSIPVLCVILRPTDHMFQCFRGSFRHLHVEGGLISDQTYHIWERDLWLTSGVPWLLCHYHSETDVTSSVAGMSVPWSSTCAWRAGTRSRSLRWVTLCWRKLNGNKTKHVHRLLTHTCTEWMLRRRWDMFYNSMGMEFSQITFNLSKQEISGWILS